MKDRNTRPLEWVLFDWNGTLLDDAEYGIAIVNELCVEFNVPAISKERYLKHFGFPLIEFYEKMGFDFSKYSFDHLSQVFMQKYHENLATITLHDEVIEVLTELSHSYRLGIISAYKQSRLIEAVSNYGVAHFFECVYGIADDRADSKSHSLKQMLTTHAINPAEAILVGDTLHDYEVAEENGIPALLIEEGHQSREQWVPFNVTSIDSLKDLPRFLEQW